MLPVKFLFRVFVCANFLLLTACEKQADNRNAASTSLANAQKLYVAGQYQSASAEIAASIKADPKGSEARLLAGEIAEKLGDPNTAFTQYVGAGSEKGRLAAASLLIRVRSYSVAEAWIAKCLADLPSDRTMKAYRALLQERLGNTRKARSDAEAVIAEDSGNVIANAVLAEEALARRDPAYALTIIEVGLKNDTSDKALLQLKAQALSQQNLPEEAGKIYRGLISADPTVPEYRAALAEQMVKSSGVEPAEQVLRDGVTASPDNIEMHMRLIAFLARHRDEKAVTAELLSAIAAAPKTTVYDIALSDIYVRNGDFAAAAKILNNAMSRTVSGEPHANAQLALVRLLIARDDLATAQPILDGMLKANPSNDEVLAARGQLLMKDRNPAGAIKDFLAIAARQPANTAVFSSLAEAYLQNEQHKEAIAALKRVLSLTPSDLVTLRWVVDIQASFGEFSDARRTDEEFLARNPDSVEARILEAKLAIQTKDWAAAEAALANVRKIPGSDQRALELNAEIKEAQGQSNDAAELYRRLVISSATKRFDVGAARGFARTSITAGQSSKAVDFLKAVAANMAQTDLASYDLVLATLYDSLGQFDKASSLVDEVIQIAPASPAPYLQQAAAFASRKDITKALAMLDRGAAAGAAKEPLLLVRGQIQRSAGQVDDAIRTYREILRLNPNSTVGANELADTLSDQKPLDKLALRDARNILQKNATFKNPAIVDTLAWSDYRLEEYTRAKDLLTSVNASQSEMPQLRFHYGAVVMALGDRASGGKIIKETLNEMYPGRSEAELLLSN